MCTSKTPKSYQALMTNWDNMIAAKQHHRCHFAAIILSDSGILLFRFFHLGSANLLNGARFGIELNKRWSLLVAEQIWI